MLKIPQKEKLLFWLMRILGSLVMVLGLIVMFVPKIRWGIPVFLIGVVISLVGENLYEQLYRCPNCNTYLHEKGYRGHRTNKLYEFCPGCGWKVNVVDEDF